MLRVDADGTNVSKVPLLIVEPKQKLIPSAPDYVIPEAVYDTIRTPIIFDFNGRMIIPWSVRRIGALADNTVELQRVVKGARILEVECLDHLIVGRRIRKHPGYFSFQEAGLL